MSNYTYIVAGLAAFDLVLLIILYRYLRSHGHVDRRVVVAVAFSLIGFLVHALLFFSGALLLVQLATIGSIFGLYWIFSFDHRKDEA
jgi:hypothetical protein